MLFRRKWSKRNLTDKAKERKEKIVAKLFYWKSILLLNSNLFISVLLFFKSFVLAFEQKELLIHGLHKSLNENFCTFFGLFMKFEAVNNMWYNKLNLINFASDVRRLKTLYVGDKNEKLVSLLRKNKIQREIATDFYRELHTVCYCCSLYSTEIRVKQSSS